MRSRLSSLLESGVESYARAALDLPDLAWPDVRSPRRAGPTRSWSSLRRRPSPSTRFAFRPAPTRSTWRPFLGWAALVALPSIASRDSRASVGSYRSTASIGSAWSVGSVLSVASFLSAGSFLSVGSAGSILSIGSSGSILSIGSSGSILSLASSGALAGRGSAHGDERGDAGPDPAVVRRISGLLAMAAIVSAPFTRRAA